jgi:hypothetical protein
MNLTRLPRTDLPEFLTAFSAMHDAMCRDAERLVLAAPDLAAADLVPLRPWWSRFEQSIVHHHEREDQVVFPRLAERSPSFEPVRTELHRDHEELDRAMDDLGSAIQRSDVVAFAPASLAFREILEDHLGREEAIVFPALIEHVGAEGFAAIEQEMSQGSSLREIAFELPWVLDGTGERLDAMVADMLPAPVRLLNRAVFTPRYRRLSAALTAHPS